MIDKYDNDFKLKYINEEDPEVLLGLFDDPNCTPVDAVNIFEKIKDKELAYDKLFKVLDYYRRYWYNDIDYYYSGVEIYNRIDKDQIIVYFQDAIKELLKFDDDKITIYLTSCYGSSFYGHLTYYLNNYFARVINNCSEEAKKAISEMPYANKALLLAVAITTHDFDTFAKCVMEVHGYQILQALYFSKTYKDLILSNHPKAREVSEKVRPYSTFYSIINPNIGNIHYIGDFLREINIFNYINIGTLSENETTLIKNSDEVEISKKKITLKCENIDVIKRDMKRDNKSKIVYGYYPTLEVGNVANEILKIAYNARQLNKTGKIYKLVDKDGKIINCPEFQFRTRRYAKLGRRDDYRWMEVNELVWKYDNERNRLVLTNDIPMITNDPNEALLELFKTDMLQPYRISEEELRYKLEKDKEKGPSKFKEKLVNSKDKKEEMESTREEKYKLILYHLSEIDKLVKSLRKDDVKNAMMLSSIMSKVVVPDDMLLIKVDDHLEFNPDFVPYFEYINLAGVDCSNLKLSGYKLKKTNIKINPQKVYKKDLSNTTLSDANVRWGSFKGVNLCGSNVEDEKESFDFDQAITDENTKLPKKTKVQGYAR